MKQIPLTRDKFAIVDDEDFEFVMRFSWYAWKHPQRNVWYAICKSRSHIRQRMHRMLMKAKNLQVDHADGDGLNNTRKNLRFCTNQQNNRNKGITKANVSGVVGVNWHKQTKKWRAYIKINDKQKHLGLFNTIEEARIVRENEAKKLFGIFYRSSK